MQERVLTDVAIELLSRHSASCECFRCRSLHDLLDARKERDEAGPLLEAARCESRQHTLGGTKARLALLTVSGHPCQCGLCATSRDYDAARAVGEDRK